MVWAIYMTEPCSKQIIDGQKETFSNQWALHVDLAKNAKKRFHFVRQCVRAAWGQAPDMSSGLECKTMPLSKRLQIRIVGTYDSLRMICRLKRIVCRN